MRRNKTRPVASAFGDSILLLVPALAAAACTVPQDAAVTAPGAVVLGVGASAPIFTRATAAMEHTIVQPCTAELVDLSGALQVEVLARALDADRYEASYVVQATNVTGQAQPSEGRYRLEGAATGQMTLRHQERAVTVADFRLIATGAPGVDIGRARAAAGSQPGVQVTLGVSLSPDGRLKEAAVDAVTVDQKCGE
jgi:hypothetical protein